MAAIRWCLLLFFFAYALSLTVDPWYVPVKGMKRIFNSIPTKISSASWNRTYLAPLKGEGEVLDLYDWTNQDFRKKALHLVFPCNTFPGGILNGYFVALGDTAQSCPCTYPGEMACPPHIYLKIGDADYVAVSDRLWHEQWPAAFSIPLSKMKNDIVDAKVVMFINDPPAFANQTVGGNVDPTKYNGCAPAKNPAQLKGNVALIKKALCDELVQFKNARAAGAIAVLMIKVDLGPVMTEPVLPGVSIYPEADITLNVSNSVAAGVPVLIKFGPRIGDLNPPADQDTPRTPLGLTMLSYTDYSIVSTNSEIFRQNPPFMWVFPETENIVYMMKDDVTSDTTITYLNVSGSRNEKAHIVKQFDITSKGYPPNSYPYLIFTRGGHNYIMTATEDDDAVASAPEPTIQFYLFDITDESSTKLVWRHNFTGLVSPEVMLIEQNGTMFLGFPFALIYSVDFPTLWWYDFGDPTKPKFVSKMYDPSLWFAYSDDGSKQWSYWPLWSYVNGYLVMLTMREGIQIYDVSDFYNIKIYSQLLHLNPNGRKAITGFALSGYDPSIFYYKGVPMVCHGHNTWPFVYSEAVCSVFGDTSPWKRQFKTTPFPISNLKTRNLLESSSNFSISSNAHPDSTPIKVVVGSVFACALFESGSVRCWGKHVATIISDIAGFLGYGNQASHETPIISILEFEDPTVASRIIDLSTGHIHSCAVLFRPKEKVIQKAYSLFCWGSAASGRLGYGDSNNVGEPDTPRIKGPIKFKDSIPLKVFTGQFHTCAIMKNLTSNLTVARCWGDSTLGQLGDPLVASQWDAANARDIPIGGEPVTMALGSFHSCVLTTEGRMKCWGSAFSGQIGVNTSDPSSSQYDIRDPSTLPFISTPRNMKVQDICAGSLHTCALMENNEVYCLGSNDRGQRGVPFASSGEEDLRTFKFDKPVRFNTNDTIAGLSCGYIYTCVWFTTGSYLCWGDNTLGALGFETPSSIFNDPYSLPPVRLSGGSIDWIGAGEGQTCVLLTSNGQKKIRCWGTNFLNTSIVTRSNTADIWPLNSNKNYVHQISAYHHTCVLVLEKVKCWGWGNGFELGTVASDIYGNNDGDTEGVLLPGNAGPYVVDQYIPTTPISVVAGEFCGCALLKTGNVSCWGYCNQKDHDTGSLTKRFAEVTNTTTNPVIGVFLPKTLAGGCIIFQSGDPWCFCPIIYMVQTTSFIKIPALKGKIIQFAMGYSFQCALDDRAQVACFGVNAAGQLGLGDNSVDWITMDKTELAKIPPGEVVKIAAGKNHACALYRSGDVACWGSSLFGQTGYGTIEDMGDDEPVSGYVDIGPYPAIDISCGNAHTCVVVQAPDRGRVVCWGENIYGQPGYPNIFGNVGDDETPAQAGFVPMNDDVTSVAAGSYHTCVLTRVGTVKCWGNGQYGRLGYADTKDIRDPSTVPDISLTCGDGVKEYNEECDDGNFFNGDGCNKFCKIEHDWTCRAASGTYSLCARCGDFVVSLDETCDDGNTIDGDGCNSVCGVEKGWVCERIRGTLCDPIHGDGMVVGNEQCDMGNMTGISPGCSSESQILPGFYCKTSFPFSSTCWSVCGDAKKSSTEACDDGNIDNGDGCSSSCSIESGWTCYVSCDSSLNCKSVCSGNSDESSKVGLIVGLCVGLSLLVILLLLLLFFCMGKKRQILIKESDLTLIRKIGEGDFGEVYEAKWKSTTVAVKQRKIDGISEDEIKMFSKEARVMQALPPHPNLVQFLGLCSTSDKLTIVCEFVEKGSVKRFLQEDCGKNTVTKRNQLELCLGICAGMDHLHSNGITHRDLACRNVLVEVKRSGNGSSLVSKISDFGLSVATSKQTRLPVRWTAPEVLKNPRLRNNEADVWSFGVTMYEVFTRCSELPYLGKKNQEVVAFVLGGGHLKEPPQVDGSIRDVMMDCFKFKPEWRPPFITLSARFEDIIKDMTNPTMTSNDTFSTVDTVETTSMNMFSDEDENDYMSMAKSDYSNLTSSNVKKGNTYEVVKSTDYESLAK